MIGYIYYKTPTNINLLNTIKLTYTNNEETNHIYGNFKNIEQSDSEFVSETIYNIHNIQNIGYFIIDKTYLTDKNIIISTVPEISNDSYRIEITKYNNHSKINIIFNNPTNTYSYDNINLYLKYKTEENSIKKQIIYKYTINFEYKPIRIYYNFNLLKNETKEYILSKKQQNNNKNKYLTYRDIVDTLNNELKTNFDISQLNFHSFDIKLVNQLSVINIPHDNILNINTNIIRKVLDSWVNYYEITDENKNNFSLLLNTSIIKNVDINNIVKNDFIYVTLKDLKLYLLIVVKIMHHFNLNFLLMI